MKLSVLGEIRLSTDDRPVKLGNGRERDLLVHLALTNGDPLSARELADRLWNGFPPSAYRSTLHTYVTRLRRRLESAGIDRTVLAHNGGGYVLRLSPQELDWERLLRLRSRASALKQTGEHRSARSTLAGALGLWRGTPLAGLSGRWAERMRVTMERAHQEILEEWAKLSLVAGEPAHVLRVLDGALARYPTHEPLHLCALRAMHALGRTADALVAYQDLRNRLSEELGSSPSLELQREFHRILKDTSSAPTENTKTDFREPFPLRDNLDRDTRFFRGRKKEAILLSSHLCEPHQETPRTWIISGMPGVGKTTLAVHSAHRVKEHFPDARLQLDLRGNHEQLPPLTAGEAITELLRMLRLPAKHIPDAFHDQISLWREHTRSLRALVILDDAATAEQVLPLLPTGNRCATIITSRLQLPEIDEAERLPLGIPSLSESLEMFSAASGRSTEEDSSETDLREEVVSRCGRLPLAMQLTATLLRLNPRWTLQDILSRLPKTVEQGVGAFRVGQRDMAKVFDLSLRTISPEAREAFLLLGLHPTRTFCADVATALIGRGKEASRRLLDELVGVSLIEEYSPDRFKTHTLVKSHAFHHALASLSPDMLRAARERMYSAYLESCRSADLSLYPHRQGLDSEESGEGVERWETEQAEAWLRNELPTVLTVIGDAHSQGAGRVASDLAHALAEHLDVHGPWQNAPALHEQALCWHEQQRSARGVARASFDLARALRRTNRLEQAMSHNTVAREQWALIGDELGVGWGVAQSGLFHFVSGRYDQGTPLLEEALETFQTSQSRSGVVFALHIRGLCSHMTSKFHEAIADYSDAIAILERSHDLDNLLDVQMNLAGALQQLGYHREAWALCEKVLATVRSRGDDRRLSVAWSNMGELALHRQRPEQAVECLTHALSSLQRFHDPWTQSSVLANLGAAHVMADRPEEARGYFQRSLGFHLLSSPTVVVDALLGLAKVEQACGNALEATHHLHYAVDTATRHGLRKERARALHALGQHLNTQSSGTDGRSQLEEAAFLYQELAAPEADLLHSLLDAMP